MPKEVILDINTDFDFGFTSVAEEEIQRPAQNKAQAMYDAILPLLNSLMKDSDTRPYIHWPNRVQKISEFKNKLNSILNSDME